MKSASKPNAIFISTGEEVLSGECIDTNASWISEFLNQYGFSMHSRFTVGDRMEDLIDTMRYAAKLAPVIIMNGGLGPTSDDLSVEAAGKLLNETLVFEESWKTFLLERFAKMGRKMPDSNLKQCYRPKSGSLLHNPIGTAPGVHFRFQNSDFFLTPGVPSEFKRMAREQILPILKNSFPGAKAKHLRRLFTFGVSEATMGQWVSDFLKGKNFSYGFRAHAPLLEVKMWTEDDQREAELDKVWNELPEHVQNVVVSRDGIYPENLLVEHGIKHGWTLATAESCTGGLLASKITSIPGSSAVLNRGFVTYANEAKEELLGISKQTLQTEGAVSMSVAKLMAQNVRSQAGTDFGIGITGIAGPSGGTEDKPVGTVVFGLATAKKCFVQHLELPNFGRRRLQKASCTLALDMLRRQLFDIPVFGEYEMIRRIQSEISEV